MPNVLDRWRALGKNEEALCRDACRSFTNDIIDSVLESLRGRSTLEALVDDIVLYLERSPYVLELVERVVTEMADEPSVQDLIQQQSTQLTDQLVQEARGGLTRADEAVERTVGTILRRLGLHRGGRPGSSGTAAAGSGP